MTVPERFEHIVAQNENRRECKRKRASGSIGVVVPPERFLNCVPGVRVTPGVPTHTRYRVGRALLTSAAATRSPIQPSRIRSREGRKVRGRRPPPPPRR